MPGTRLEVVGHSAAAGGRGGRAGRGPGTRPSRAGVAPAPAYPDMIPAIPEKTPYGGFFCQGCYSNLSNLFQMSSSAYRDCIFLLVPMLGLYLGLSEAVRSCRPARTEKFFQKYKQNSTNHDAAASPLLGSGDPSCFADINSV